MAVQYDHADTLAILHGFRWVEVALKSVNAGQNLKEHLTGHIRVTFSNVIAAVRISCVSNREHFLAYHDGSILNQAAGKMVLK